MPIAPPSLTTFKLPDKRSGLIHSTRSNIMQSVSQEELDYQIALKMQKEFEAEEAGYVHVDLPIELMQPRAPRRSGSDHRKSSKLEVIDVDAPSTSVPTVKPRLSRHGPPPPPPSDELVLQVTTTTTTSKYVPPHKREPREKKPEREPREPRESKSKKEPRVARPAPPPPPPEVIAKMKPGRALYFERSDDGFDLDYEQLAQLEDVPFGLTPTQLGKIPKKNYRAGLCGDHNLCGICLCAYELNESLRHLPCQHYYHTECVDHWFSLRPTCPFCLQNIAHML